MQIQLKKYISTVGGVLASLLITATIIFLFMVSYFYLYLPAVTNHGETVTVPEIEGMQLSELEDFLVTRNLRYEISDSSYSEKFPPLTVLKQYPHAGDQVKENRVVYISINRIKPPTVPMPNLVDGSLINAEVVLKGNELKRGQIELVRGPFLNLVKEMKYRGEVITAGTRIPKGSVIDLVVEDGGSNVVQVPDVIGYLFEDAKIPIFGSNLNIGDVTVVGDTVGLGSEVVILKQKPEPNENIKVGDVVELWIGKKGTVVTDDDAQAE